MNICDDDCEIYVFDYDYIGDCSYELFWNTGFISCEICELSYITIGVVLLCEDLLDDNEIPASLTSFLVGPLFFLILYIYLVEMLYF